MILERLVLGPFQSNCYILGCEKTLEAVVVDPGDDPGRIVETVRFNNLEVKKILATHCHIDHVGGVERLRKQIDAQVLIHEADLPIFLKSGSHAAMFGLKAADPSPPDDFFEDGAEIAWGDGLSLEVLHTPGHTPGGVCFFMAAESPLLLSGDTLFHRGIGRTDLPGGSSSQLFDSIKKRLWSLPGETRVLCGHGPATTIKDEKSDNPFVGEGRRGFFF